MWADIQLGLLAEPCCCLLRLPFSNWVCSESAPFYDVPQGMVQTPYGPDPLLTSRNAPLLSPSSLDLSALG